jgi:glycosyltransferase involved in cell wall biosynthesis
MRLIVFGSGHPFRGGVARATTDLVQSLEKRGHHLHFLTPTRQYPRWLFPGASDRDSNACLHLESAVRCLDPLNPLSWPGSRWRALALGADAWIIPYWTWAWAGLWRFLLRGGRPPAVAVVHNLADHDAGPHQRLAARIVLGRCQALFTHARSLEATLASVHPGVPTASHLVPPATIGPLPSMGEARDVLGLAGQRRVALFLGIIRPYKGVDLLLEAVARQPVDSDWSLVVAGEPWGRLGDALREQTRRLGIEERVHLKLGWVSELEIPTLLAAADLVVLPYRSGSQSAVAPLALGAGVPVLSTAVGGLPEVIRHGVDGWLVAPGSVAELAHVLEELDRRRLDSLAKGAIKGRGRLTWDGYAEALEGLLGKVVGEEQEGSMRNEE